MSKIIKIRIHQGLPTKIVKDQKLLKAICVFYGLKYLYTGGIILNISKRYKEISKKLKISETNLKNKVKCAFLQHIKNSIDFEPQEDTKEIFEIIPKTKKTYNKVKL